MFPVYYAMEKTALDSWIQFKSDLDNIKAVATPDQIDKVKTALIEIETSTKGQDFRLDEETGEAYISISGTLTPRPEACVSLSDGSQTLYGSIVEAIEICESEPAVKRINFITDSPGGYVAGCDMAAIAIGTAQKPTRTLVVGQCCSAAYWLTSQSDEIIALTPSAQVGSIGVAGEIIDRSEADKGRGIKRITLTSENAPNKKPDIGTDEGVAKIVSRLTDIESVFISRVAEGRKTTSENVKKNYGKGGVLIAENALKADMIDAVENIKLKSDGLKALDNTTAKKPDEPVKNNTEGKMDLKAIFAENPEAQAEHTKALDTVRADERARLDAILTVTGGVYNDAAKKAFNAGMAAGDFAIQEVSAIREGVKSADNVSELGKIVTVEASGQLGAEEENAKDKKVEAKIDSDTDAYLAQQGIVKEAK